VIGPKRVVLTNIAHQPHKYIQLPMASRVRIERAADS
jgi:hypothetical protein